MLCRRPLGRPTFLTYNSMRAPASTVIPADRSKIASTVLSCPYKRQNKKSWTKLGYLTYNRRNRKAFRIEEINVTGLFITVEGPDGAGKSSLVKRITPLIQSALSVPLVLTREPGGSEIAEEIREILLSPEHTAMDDRTEALLLAAGRRQHVVEKIIPALRRNEVVLCDRFVDSSIAYQGHARGIGMKEVAEINHFATEGLTPDLTLYLDVDAEVGLNRITDKKSNRTQDRLELEAVTFHKKVREAYHQLVKENSDRFVTVDASQTEEEVLDNCWHIIEQKLKETHLV